MMTILLTQLAARRRAGVSLPPIVYEPNIAGGTTANRVGWGRIDRTFSLDNNYTLTKFKVNYNRNTTIKLFVVRRDSPGNYTVMWTESRAHGGSGIQEYTLNSPYPVPSSGDYYAGYYNSGGSNPITSTASIAMAEVGGDPGGPTDPWSPSESTGTGPALGVTLEWL